MKLTNHPEETPGQLLARLVSGESKAPDSWDCEGKDEQFLEAVAKALLSNLEDYYLRKGAIAALTSQEVRHAVYCSRRSSTCAALDNMAEQIKSGNITPWN